MSTFKKQKQVRFAYKNTFHSPRTPAHAIPSPIPSSPGLIAPPPIGHGLPGPFPFIAYVSNPAQPAHYLGPVRSHQLLQASAVRWDLMENPSTASWNDHLLSSQALHEPATNPRLPFFSISSIHLPWKIDVYASNNSYVTLGDVLNCIYRQLRTNITTTEFNSFPRRKDQVRATRAYEQRYRRFRSVFAHDEEKRGGMKRIDFLMGYTQFHGISNTGPHSDTWQLHVTT